jgi:UDP-N-acetylglucosamine acyltransferase
MTDAAANGGYRHVGGAWVHEGARLGQNVVLEPGALVGDQVVLGDDTWVGSGGVIKGPSTLGSGNRIYSSAVIGEPPQDIGYDGSPTRLEVGDKNVFREGVTVHRGSVKGGGVTRVGSENYFMVGSHVGHDCVVEDHVVLSNDVLLAGHCHIGSHANFGGGVAIVQFTTVGRLSFVGGLSGTNKDLPPFMVHDGQPALVRGVNLVGCRRGGMPRHSIHALKDAYHFLFYDSESMHGPEDLGAARVELEKRGVLTDEVEELLGFMERTRDGLFGRMLQQRTGKEES